jgi:CRISPR-associated endoribonuclease Cas6
MRLLIKFSKNTSPVNIINQHIVNNYIYKKCLKEDEIYHNSKNDYCISSLQGGILNVQDKTLDFPNGGMIAITSQNQEFLNKITIGVLQNVDFSHGMKFNTFDLVQEEFINGWNYFATLSPFIIKEYSSKEKYKFVIFNDEKFLSKASERTNEKIKILNEKDFSEAVTNHTKNKLKKIYPNINLEDFKIEIKTHQSHKIKTIFKEFDHVNKKSVVNYANQCHVNVFCDKKNAEIIYNLGIGQSTGCGFGTIYKTENRHKYKMTY